MNDINHIWGPYLAMLQQEGNLADLYYKVKDNRVSPYLELQADNLYGNGHSGKYLKLDVNPYIRFLKIFEPLLSPDDMGYEEFNQALSDILLHYLADLDLKSGMCRQDFYTSFIIKDLESGAYGGLDELKEFTRIEKVETARWLLCFYQTGDNESCISGAAGCLLPECEVLVREGTEFVFYMREPWNETDNKKIMFLVRLFLPLSAPYTVHWTHTYGVTGYNETMRLGSFVLA